MYFLDEKHVPEERIMLDNRPLEGGTKKIISTQERIQVVQVTFKAGTVVPEHAHPEEQAGCIIKGAFEVEIGGEKGTLKPGQYYWIPSNVPHSGRVHEDTIFLDIYSPPRG